MTVTLRLLSQVTCSERDRPYCQRCLWQLTEGQTSARGFPRPSDASTPTCSSDHRLAPPTSLVPPENQYTYLGNLSFQVSPDRFQVSTYPYARTRRWRVIRRASAAACPCTAERCFNVLHLPRVPEVAAPSNGDRGCDVSQWRPHAVSSTHVAFTAEARSRHPNCKLHQHPGPRPVSTEATQIYMHGRTAEVTQMYHAG